MISCTCCIGRSSGSVQWQETWSLSRAAGYDIVNVKNGGERRGRVPADELQCCGRVRESAGSQWLRLIFDVSENFGDLR